ncbi:MAG TPA: hypothetical protein VFS14_04685 [Candidatus Saccharimonadales bacterium]|nr:hypothetical protein [Candidatus Saccharimonadales bacterium]
MENSQKPQTKTIAGLISFIALLALAVLGLVTAYYFLSDHVASLEYQVAHLKTSADDAQKEPVKNEETPAAIYREIPELGVKYKLTEQTKGLTYHFRSSEDGKTKIADFSTIALSAMKESDGVFPCTSSHAPSGIFALYENGNQIIQGKMVKELGKKVGAFYYVYSHPQYACSVNGQIVQGLQASIDAVKAAYDSLEAM